MIVIGLITYGLDGEEVRESHPSRVTTMEHPRNKSDRLWHFVLRGQEIRTISRAISCPLVHTMPLQRPSILARRKGHRDTNLVALQSGMRGKSRCYMRLFIRSIDIPDACR